MKKQLLLTGILSLLFVMFTMCTNTKKQSESETTIDSALLHNNSVKLWVLSEMWVNDEMLDISTSVDEHLLLASDNTGMQIFGETDTHHADTLTVDRFTYKLSETDAKIEISEFHESHIMANNPAMDISTLTEEKLVLYATSEVDGETNHIKLNYVRAVEPNPEAGHKNMMLTNGSSKLWKVTNVLVNGEDTNIPCRRDDLMLWLTNGMAVKIFGDIHCIPGDTVNNDVIAWGFIEDDNKIVKSDLHAKWHHESGLELVTDDTIRVIELSNDKFIWESMSKFDGVEKSVIITEVPVYLF
ncbi:MAG: hypothetical protein K9H26_13530 [Prolixibacteraceae bacterium]|nr:hypothetical protein [Prolixibacteraceae bacterium]